MQGLCQARKHGPSVLALQLYKHGAAENGRLFGALKASEQHVEPKQKRMRPVYDKYVGPVASLIKSYLAANTKYPKVSDVVRETGAPRATVQKIVDEIKSCGDGLQCVNMGAKGSDEIVLSPPTLSVIGSMLKTGIGNESSAVLDSCEYEQTDSKDPRGVSVVEAMGDGTHAEDLDISDESIEEKTHPGLLKLLDHTMQLSNKVDANKRVVPLKQVLQQKSIGSRRVHLSAGMGMENDLSWQKTLLSIMPGPAGGVKKEDPSGLTGVEDETLAGGDNGQPPPSSTKSSMEKSPHMSANKYGVMLISSVSKTVLQQISRMQLKEALEEFKGVSRVRIFLDKGFPHALVYFQTEEGMNEALKMNSIKIKGEKFMLMAAQTAAEQVTVEEVSQAAATNQTTVTCSAPAAAKQVTVEEVSQAAGADQTTVVRQFLDGMARRSLKATKGNIISFQRVSDSLSHLSEKEDTVYRSIFNALCSNLPMNTPLLSPLVSRVENAISIDECPGYVHLESLKKFFSRCGEVTSCYEEADTDGKKMVFIEFKMGSDKRNALKFQQFTVNDCVFKVRDDVPSEMLVVRLENLHSETCERKLMDVCQMYGDAKGIKPRTANTVDVHFGAHENWRILEILDSLNKVEVLQRRWKARVIYQGFQKVESMKTSCQTCQQMQQDNLKLLSLAKKLVAHIENVCAKNGGI